MSNQPNDAQIMSLEEMREHLRYGQQLVGLDVGSKTVGVAVSDGFRSIASPVDTVRRKKFSKDVEAMLEMLKGREIGGFVVGLPLHMNGDISPRTQASQAFARNMTRIVDQPITLWDERLSTVAAERALLEFDTSRAKRSEVIDHVAASVILQSALDRLSYLERGSIEANDDDDWDY